LAIAWRIAWDGRVTVSLRRSTILANFLLPCIGRPFGQLLDPFLLVGPWLNGQVAFIICLTSFLFFSALVWNAVHRARDAGWPHWLGVLAAVPCVNALATVALALPPHKKRSVWDLI
jgi:uncharacterized membrane protein YhaH (DUF805 family)